MIARDWNTVCRGKPRLHASRTGIGAWSSRVETVSRKCVENAGCRDKHESSLPGSEGDHTATDRGLLSFREEDWLAQGVAEAGRLSREMLSTSKSKKMKASVAAGCSDSARPMLFASSTITVPRQTRDKEWWEMAATVAIRSSKLRCSKLFCKQKLECAMTKSDGMAK